MTDYREKSYWLTTEAYQPSPPLEGDLSVDVAIIGGGFTGLSTALHLRQAEPVDVAVLESEVVGYGASGRNGGFAMTLFGLTLGFTKLRFGRERAKEAHHYMERAVDYVGELVESYGIDSEYELPGFLRVATTPGYVKRIQHEIELARSLGIEGIEWLEARGGGGTRAVAALPRGLVGAALRADQPGQARLGAEARGRSLRRPRLRAHAGHRHRAHERRHRARTPRGTVRAKKLVLATNAYSHLIPQARRKQVPAFTYIVLTEPLTPERLETIGWRGREGIEDARNLVHYYRLTADNRLLMGGGDVSRLRRRHGHGRASACLRRAGGVRRGVFPGLAGVQFTHRWGGPVSVPVDLVPAIGLLGDERVVYSLGCVGHGVSLTQLNGRTIADLLLGRETDLTSVLFVNRRVDPLAAGAAALRAQPGHPRLHASGGRVVRAQDAQRPVPSSGPRKRCGPSARPASRAQASMQAAQLRHVLFRPPDFWAIEHRLRLGKERRARPGQERAVVGHGASQLLVAGRARRAVPARGPRSAAV